MRYCSQCHAGYGQEERFCPHDGAAIVDENDADHPMVGRTLGGRYLIRRLIGKGGMGEVFEADHIGLDKRVAIKFLLEKFNTDREVLMRFHREARTASKIGHENIVDITDIGETEQGEAYIVMELLAGQDLGQLLRKTGPLPLHRAVHIIKQICRGLSAAHDKGIVHRDMKPENVFLTQREDRLDVVKIMDFGISKVIDAHDSKVRLTQTGAVVGTPVYMAPEQAMASHEVDHRADVYAVGVMFFELLCGRPPFEGGNYLQLVTQHLNDPPPPPRSLRDDIPRKLEALILGALVKDPSQRLPSLRELEKQLPPVPELTPSMIEQPGPVPTKSSMPPGAYAAPTAMPPRGAKRAGRTPMLLVGAAAIAAAGMIAFGYFSRDESGAGQKASAQAPPPPAPVAADAGALPAAELEPSELGSIEIDSVPQGAAVLFDGEPRGVTPLQLRDVKTGVHLVRLELARHEPLEAQKQVRAGYSETFFGALAPARSGRKSKVRPPRDTVADRPATAPEDADPKTAPPPTKPSPKPPEPRPKRGGDADHKSNPFDKDRKPNPFAD